MAVSASERRKAQAQGATLPDGSYPIRNATELKAAIRLVGNSKNYSTEKVKAHIIKRAKALGLTSLLPDDWSGGSIEQEDAVELTATLMLDNVAEPVILQEPSKDNNGIMSIKVPFYVGGSLTKVDGLRKRVYFGPEILPQIVQEGNERIAAGKQPLTVYARHSHAVSGDHLPIGAVRELVQDGRTGYSIIDVLDTEPDGKNAQRLIEHKFLNAVSLRSKEFSLENGRVDGEAVLLCERMALGGIDFAPDSPAQETFGIQILNEEARPERVEEVEDTVPSRRTKLSDQTITLEDVKRDAPEILQEVERPLRAEITTLTQELATVKAERDALVEREEASKLVAFIDDIADKTIQPDAFRAKFKELCQEKGVKTVAAATPFVTPLLLEALEAARTQQTEPAKSTEEQLHALFVQKPAGSGNANAEPPVSTTAAPAIALESAHRATPTIGGLLMPED